MNFLKSNNKPNQQLGILVEKLAKEIGVDKSVVFYFLNTDIERILSEKIQIHNAKLRTLEINFNEFNHKEQNLIKEIKNKENDISNIKNRINELEKKKNQSENQYSSLQQELADLEIKLNEVNRNLITAANSKKQIDYKLLIQKHSLNEKTNVSFKRLGLILSIFSLIAIFLTIIIILILKK